MRRGVRSLQRAGRLRVRRRDVHQRVGLANAQPTPVRERLVADVDHEVRALLELAEPGGTAPVALAALDHDRFAERCQAAGEVLRAGARTRSGVQRQQRERARSRVPAPPALACSDALQRHARQDRERRRVVLGELLEARPRDPDQLAVAQRAHRGAARLSGDHSGLAHRLARQHLAEQALALGVVLVRGQAAREHHEHGVGRIALAKQRRAAGQHERLELARQGVARRFRQREHPGQRLGNAFQLWRALLHGADLSAAYLTRAARCCSIALRTLEGAAEEIGLRSSERGLRCIRQRKCCTRRRHGAIYAGVRRSDAGDVVPKTYRSARSPAPAGARGAAKAAGQGVVAALDLVREGTRPSRRRPGSEI